jgi:hypothetical protein
VPEGAVRVPIHPLSTAVFVLACWAISLTTIVRYPENAGIGVAILLVGAVVFQFWKKGSGSNAQMS